MPSLNNDVSWMKDLNNFSEKKLAIVFTAKMSPNNVKNVKKCLNILEPSYLLGAESPTVEDNNNEALEAAGKTV